VNGISRPRSRTSRTILQLRLICHQLEHCLHVTLRARLKPLACGLTAREVLDKPAAIQMLDVHFPTSDGRTLILSRYTELNTDSTRSGEPTQARLPSQPPPRITRRREANARRAPPV
jgi:hypothetical protein